MATPRSSATTRSWPPGPTPERSSTPGCARARPTPPRGVQRFVEELVPRLRRAGADRHRSSCASTRASGPNETIAVLGSPRASLHHGRAHRAPRPWPRPSPPSTRMTGSRSPTPTVAEARWPSAPTRAAPHRAPHPPGRSPGHLVARLAPLRLRDRSRGQLRSSSTPSTVTTPSSSCASTTSKRARAWSTARRGTSRPTRPGCAAPCSPTTLMRWSAQVGPDLVDDDTLVVASNPADPLPSPRSRTAPSTAPDVRPFEPQPVGPGPAPSPEHSPTCVPSPVAPT